ncbi:MAG: tetratricopeptide repeat protein [Halococcoides sp.]
MAGQIVGRIGELLGGIPDLLLGLGVIGGFLTLLGIVLGFVWKIGAQRIVGGVLHSLSPYVESIPWVGPALATWLRDPRRELLERTPEPVENGKSPIQTLADEQFRVLDGDDWPGPIDREYCWRRPFTMAEIHEGIPIERCDSDGSSVLNALRTELADGGGVALLGGPGTGKTTTSRQVLERWASDEATGPAVYRTERGTAIDDPGGVATAVRSLSDDPVLVVIDDVARPGTVPVLAAMPDLAADDGVSVLVNSREREWEALEQRARQYGAVDLTTDAGQQLLETTRKFLALQYVPPLHAGDVDRIINAFEDATGRTVSQDSDALLERIRSGPQVSQMLLLSYHLPVGGVETTDEAGYDSALHRNVVETYRRINDPETDSAIEGAGTEILSDVALAVAVLAAAELPLRSELLYAVGESGTYDRIDDAREALQGTVLFGTDTDGSLFTHHPLWAEIYLDHHLEAPVGGGVDQFERVVNALFAFVDENGDRDAVRQYLWRSPAILDEIDENTTANADSFVQSIFEVGIARPNLVDLFGESEYSGIDLPEVCSPESSIEATLTRGKMFRSTGDRDAAGREIRRAETILGDINDRSLEARVTRAKGNLARSRGDDETTEEYYKESLNISRKIGDRAGEAKSLNNLGMVARSQGNYEKAKEYYKESLKIKREINERAGEAKSLNNLGVVARSKGDFEMAKDHYEESLKIKRGIGDRPGEAKTLNNLGFVAKKSNDLQNAIDQYKSAALIKEEIGAIRSYLTTCRNLVRAYHVGGDSEAAEEWFDRAMTAIEESDLDLDDELRDLRDLEPSENT